MGSIAKLSEIIILGDLVIMYICEKCGKVVNEKFGSGRFCSRSCANSHKVSEQTKQHISEGIKKETLCNCQYCGKQFNTLTSKASHERLCVLNPDKIKIIKHSNKLDKKVKLYGSSTKTTSTVELDITNKELEEYRKTHTVCEICGKSVSDAVKWDSKFAAKNLCIDHNHNTLKFRGLLCQLCNRQLGWYEKYKQSIEDYLETHDK